MADYSGEQFSLPTCGNQSNSYWAGRWEFSLNKINSTTYSYSATCYLQLTDSSKKARNTRVDGDWRAAYLRLYIPEVGVDQKSTGPYGPLIGGTGWQKYRDTLSGTFTVSSQIDIHPGFEVWTGWGSSMGTQLFAVDTWWPSLGTYTVSGVTPAVPSNPRCTGKTSSSISMTFDVDWGGEGTTFDPACTLLNSSGTEIKVIRNGTTSGTFTGLSRYTKYYIRGYASNSAGGGYTNNVEVWTDPENPTVSKPTISNIGRLTTTVTPGVVTDNGGKTITEVETYIKGGAFGNTLKSIGKGTGAKNVSGLEPNTTYQVITRATNGITESYSAYESFTTIGNPPTITDVYAKDITTTNATIAYTATYDHNASFSKFVVQWRYPGSSTWTTLSASNNKITGVSNLNTDIIEYRITVTDNWNRSTTSAIYDYTMIEDLTNSVGDLKVVTNSDYTYTVSTTWNQKLYNKIKYVDILCEEEGQQTYEKVGNATVNSSGISIKTKQYKNKRTKKNFVLFIKYTCNSREIFKYYTVNGEAYPNAINIISKKANNLSKPMSTIVKNINNLTELKTLKQHDIIKLSRKMRYIQLDSKGTYDDTIISSITDNIITIRNIQFKYSLNITHISGILYRLSITNINVKTTDNKTIRIRNNNISINVGLNSGSKYKSIKWFLPNITINGSWQSIDTSNYNSYLESNDSYNLDLSYYVTFSVSSNFDFGLDNSATYNQSCTLTAGNVDILNNHLCKIEVYDNTGTNVALNKTIKLVDGSSPSIYNGGNAINGSTLDNNKFIYSNNGSPMILDLGKEYIISKIKIWRRNGNNKYKYGRNYIHGRNGNNELCYIFYDSSRDLEYIENINGKEFKIN